jgi:hypothetical protein
MHEGSGGSKCCYALGGFADQYMVGSRSGAGADAGQRPQSPAKSVVASVTGAEHPSDDRQRNNALPKVALDL